MVELINLQKIFNARAFVIPDFQRGYAWKEEQRTDLLRDLEDLARGGSAKQHYTGTVVVHRGTHGPQIIKGTTFEVVDIVDGQQRFTTVVILISCVADVLSALALSDAKETAAELRRTYSEHRGLMKLTLGGGTQQFFVDHILGDAPNPAPRLPAERNLLDAKVEFRAYLTEYLEGAKDDAESLSRLEGMIALVTTRVGFILFEVQDQAEVGVMFESMNARGRPLTQFELVKNFLLYVASKVSDGLRLKALGDEVNATWAKVLAGIEDAGDAADEDALMRYHWVIFPGAAWFHEKKLEKTSDIHRAIKHTIAPRSTDADKTYAQIQEYLLSLRGATPAYIDLVRPDLPNAFKFAGTDREQLVEGARRLRRIDRGAALMPLLMASTIRFGDKPDELREVFRLAEVFAFRLLLQGMRSHTGVGAVYLLARNVGLGKLNAIATQEFLRDLVKSYASDADMKATLLFADGDSRDGNFYAWRGILYFLFEYERYRSEQLKQKFAMDWAAFYRRGIESVEHILPEGENTLQKEYWKKRFTPEQFRKNRHRLGNLTITEWNGSYGNKGFDEKRGASSDLATVKTYRNSKWIAERELDAYAEWTVKEIDDRQQRLADFALKRWAL